MINATGTGTNTTANLINDLSGIQHQSDLSMQQGQHQPSHKKNVSMSEHVAPLNFGSLLPPSRQIITRSAAIHNKKHNMILERIDDSG